MLFEASPLLNRLIASAATASSTAGAGGMIAPQVTCNLLHTQTHGIALDEVRPRLPRGLLRS